MAGNSKRKNGRNTESVAGTVFSTTADELSWPLPGSEIAWLPWLNLYFGHVATAPPAEHHTKFWDWIDDLKQGVVPPTFIACWPRGGGKSSTCELGAVRVGVKLGRRFLLVVCEKQSQANERVQAISSLFTRYGVGNAVNQLGHSRGWRRDQLRTENGFNVAGIGLDVAARGIKLDEFRPDWVHFDDIDGREDTKKATDKKERTITQTILKAGATDLAVSFGQNLIHTDSIMARILSGAADYLLDRIVSGPIPAIKNFDAVRVPKAGGGLRWSIVSGTPVWEGQSLEVCQASINQSGIKAFRRESLHEVEESEGGLWDRDRDIRYWNHEASPLPDFTRIVVAVDPSGSARGDEVGIVVAGAYKLPSGVRCGVVLDDKSDHMGVKQWAKRATELFYDWQADKLLAESNFGGDMVVATFETADEREDDGRGKLIRAAPKVTLVRVSRGKVIRAGPIQRLYEEGLILHRVRFPLLESQQCTWHPESGQESPGALDACVIALSELFEIADYVHPEKPSKRVAYVPTVGGFNRARP